MKVSKSDKKIAEMLFDMEQAEKRTDDAIGAVGVAVNTYNGLQAKYQPFITELNAEDSGNATWAEKQAKVAAYVLEFAAMKTWAIAVLAGTGVTKP